MDTNYRVRPSTGKKLAGAGVAFVLSAILALAVSAVVLGTGVTGAAAGALGSTLGAAIAGAVLAGWKRPEMFVSAARRAASVIGGAHPRASSGRNATLLPRIALAAAAATILLGAAAWLLWPEPVIERPARPPYGQSGGLGDLYQADTERALDAMAAGASGPSR